MNSENTARSQPVSNYLYKPSLIILIRGLLFARELPFIHKIISVKFKNFKRIKDLNNSNVGLT